MFDQKKHLSHEEHAGGACVERLIGNQGGHNQAAQDDCHDVRHCGSPDFTARYRNHRQAESPVRCTGRCMR